MTWEQYIVQKGHPVLDGRAREVATDEIPGPQIQGLLDDMRVRLEEQYDGVALAAPQLGADVRIFIVSPKAFKKMHLLEHLVYINPTIVRQSKKLIQREEGCLSIRGIYGKTMRHERATVQALDETGRPFTRSASGLLAHIFQHETDHLNGILFDSHATDIVAAEPVPQEQV